MVDLASGLVPDSILALHGVAAEGIVVGAGGGWADGLDEVSDISTFELDGASYSRLTGTFSVERIGDDWILFVEGFSAVDLSDSDARIGVWLSRSDTDALVGFEADAAAPTGSYLPAWPDGAVVRPIEPVTVGGSGEPDTTGSSDGDVWTSTGDGLPAQWEAPSGGGGGLAWEAADPVPVTGSGSQSADLSGLTADEGSVWVQCDSGITQVTLSLPDPDVDHQPVTVAVLCPGGSTDVVLSSLNLGSAGSTPLIVTAAIVDSGAGRLWLPSGAVYT